MRGAPLSSVFPIPSTDRSTRQAPNANGNSFRIYAFSLVLLDFFLANQICSTSNGAGHVRFSVTDGGSAKDSLPARVTRAAPIATEPSAISSTSFPLFLLFFAFLRCSPLCHPELRFFRLETRPISFASRASPTRGSSVSLRVSASSISLAKDAYFQKAEERFPSLVTDLSNPTSRAISSATFPVAQKVVAQTSSSCPISAYLVLQDAPRSLPW